MDLTKSYPRSVKDKLSGVVMLARTADKARAFKGGSIGEYHYDCPMDRAVLDLLGIEVNEFADQAYRLTDEQLEQWVRERYVSKKSPFEIERFNSSFLQRKPEPGSESEQYFLSLRDGIDPTRTDITTWPELLDLEEKRFVPRRKAA